MWRNTSLLESHPVSLEMRLLFFNTMTSISVENKACDYCVTCLSRFTRLSLSLGVCVGRERDRDPESVYVTAYLPHRKQKNLIFLQFGCKRDWSSVCVSAFPLNSYCFLKISSFRLNKDPLTQLHNIKSWAISQLSRIIPYE